MPKETVSVNNFDEVRLALKKELKIIGTKLEKSITSLRNADNVSAVDLVKLDKIKETVSMLAGIYDEFVKHMELKPIINVTTPDVNIPEIKIPEINVPEIKIPDINVPAPQVTVKNDFEIGELLKALEPLKLLSRNPNSPLTVRLSDGKKFIDALTKASEDLAESAGKMGVVFAGGGHSINTIDNTANNPVPVNIVSGSSAGTEYTDGDSAPANPEGGTIVFNDGGTMTAVSDTSPLPVSATIDTTGLATSAKQDTGNTTLSSIDGKITACNTGAVVISSGSVTANAGTNLNTSALNLEATQNDIKTSVQLIDDAVYTDGTGTPSKGIAVMGTDGTNPQIVSTNASGHLNIADGGNTITVDGTVSVTGVSTLVEQQSQTTHLATIAGDTTSLDSKITACNTGAVVVSSSALPTDAATQTTLAAINAKLVTGTDIGDVTINNASGVAAVNIQDGGNTITVDGTVVANGGGTAGSANSGVMTVQGIASMTPVQVSQATASNLNVTEASAANALTALQLIDDGVYTDDTSTHSTGTSKGYGIMGVATPTDSAVNANDFGHIAMTTDRQMQVRATVASGGIASGAIASGAIASGAVASGAIASGAIASGAIATGAIAAGTASIAQTEDTAHSNGEHLVKVGTRRIDTLATSVDTSGDWATPNQSAEGALWATLSPTTTSGCSIFRTIDLDETEEDVKTSAGNLYGYYFANTTSSARYLKFYNATAASVSVGTTTPVITYYLPPTSAGHVGLPYPISFGTAICVAATTGVADADTGAPGANDVIFNAYYK